MGIIEAMAETGLWWLGPTPDEASAPLEVREAWAAAEQKLGFVPNVQRLYALRPRRFLAWLAHYQDVMRGPSGLSVIEREMIAVVVSHRNRCHYCLTSHSGYLRVLSDDATLPARLIADGPSAAPDARGRAILEHALALTRDPHGTGPADIAALRAAGLGDDEIFDVVETAAMFNFTNRLTSGLGMVPNPEFDEMGR